MIVIVRSSSSSRFSLLPQGTETVVPTESKLRGDAVPTTLAFSVFREEVRVMHPVVVRLDGMAHILHSRLMKFHGSLQFSGLPENALKLVLSLPGNAVKLFVSLTVYAFQLRLSSEKNIVNHFAKKGGEPGKQRGIHGHGYARGCPLFSLLKLPLEKVFENIDVVL